MIVWSMRISCWMPKPTNAQVVSQFFSTATGCTNAPQCHVVLTLPVLSLFIFIRLKAGE